MKLRSLFSFSCAVMALLAGGVAVAQAQTPHPAAAPAKLAFEVASIHPSAPLDMAKIRADVQAGRMPRLGDYVNASEAQYYYEPLRRLIAYAYGVKDYQVSGPAWLATERFDILAKMPDGASKDDAPAMMRTLLASRFGLVAHRTQEEHKVLALVVGKDGPKLQASPAAPAPIDEDAALKPGEMKLDTPNGQIRVTRHADGSVTMNMGKKGTITQRVDAQTQTLHLESSTVTMAGFADMLTNVLRMGGGGLQVVDMTGLKGNYQVALDISLADLMAAARRQGFMPPPAAASSAASRQNPAALASDPGGGTTVFASVEKLGLRLEERKATIEQLVIDHIEKTPTAN